MELREVIARRRMVRRYAPDPVDPAVVDRALAHATRSPSAGNSQGWAFVVLDTPGDVRRYWEATVDPSVLATPGRWLRGMMTAPVLIVPCSSKAAYLSRYAEPDKGWEDRAEARWAMPYWHMDTAMASLLVLLTAVDEGLGACFFGIPPERYDALRAALSIPEDHEPIGAITLGHRLDAADATADGSGAEARGSAARRPRRPVEQVVHRGGWRR